MHIHNTHTSPIERAQNNDVLLSEQKRVAGVILSCKSEFMGISYDSGAVCCVFELHVYCAAYYTILQVNKSIHIYLSQNLLIKMRKLHYYNKFKSNQLYE